MPGDLDSNVKHNLNYEKISGNWINIYDRLQLNETLKCFGVQIEPSENPKSYDEYMDAVSVSYDEYMEAI